MTDQTKTPEQEFISWWRSSKYCQVVIPETGWEQIARDSFMQGYNTRADVAYPVSKEDAKKALREWDNSQHLIASSLHWETKRAIRALLEAAVK